MTGLLGCKLLLFNYTICFVVLKILYSLAWWGDSIVMVLVGNGCDTIAVAPHPAPPGPWAWGASRTATYKLITVQVDDEICRLVGWKHTACATHSNQVFEQSIMEASYPARSWPTPPIRDHMLRANSSSAELPEIIFVRLHWLGCCSARCTSWYSSFSCTAWSMARN